ncbi:MAG: MFS transporter [Muribaculaceae bacterium]|nr:MFS transporter [Muribaculaceae bacterium]
MSNKFSIRKYTAIIAILMVLVMTVLDVTLINVSLPVLAAELHVSDSLTVWLVTVYQLIITMLLLPLSSVGDLYSYRRNFLVGVVIFTIASGLCALSGSFTMILISRAIQGFGAACVMSVNIALTRLIYPREILGRGLALNAMVIAVATAAGPTIAGAILSVASWHWLFLINIPLGVIAFCIGLRLLPQNPPKEHKAGYDWISAIENVVTFGLIFYALGSFARKGDLGINIILLLIGIGVGIFYVRRQLHRESPMLPVDLFRIRLYSLSIITSVSSFIAQNLVMISLPFLFLNNFGFSEITTGFLMTPLPLVTIIVAPLAARYIEHHNPGLTASVGMGVYAVGIILLSTLSHADASVVNIAWRMAVCGIGFGLFQTPNNVVMVIATPLHRTGSAGGMQSTARLVGQTLGATFVTLIFAMSLPVVSVRVCLYLATGMALLAGIFSLNRVGRIKQQS